MSGCCWVLGAAIMNTEASADKHAVDLNFFFALPSLESFN